MYSTFYYSIGIPVLVTLLASLTLHGLGRILLFSSHRRSRFLYGKAPWLPLRKFEHPLQGEEVEFQSTGRVTLRGTFIRHQASQRRGTIVFCHELNGSRLSISPYVESLVEKGFDILTFDFRNHGGSEATHCGYPTPWVTTADMDDVQAALRYLYSRSELEIDGVSIFGLGKGATVALCVAGSDPRVKSVVLDAPMPEDRLFDKNCWEVFVKSVRLSRHKTTLLVSLLFRALLYTITCPAVSLLYAWRRFMLGLWFGCHFVNPWPLVKKVKQPIMIVHGYVDSLTRADQIQSFCDRMATRPKLWIVSSAHRDALGTISEDCSRSVARFFEEATV